MKIKSVKAEWFYDEIQYTAIFEDGSEKFLFGRFKKEPRIAPNQLIGLTEDEAYELDDRLNIYH